MTNIDFLYCKAIVDMKMINHGHFIYIMTTICSKHILRQMLRTSLCQDLNVK